MKFYMFYLFYQRMSQRLYSPDFWRIWKNLLWELQELFHRIPGCGCDRRGRLLVVSSGQTYGVQAVVDAEHGVTQCKSTGVRLSENPYHGMLKYSNYCASPPNSQSPVSKRICWLTSGVLSGVEAEGEGDNFSRKRTAHRYFSKLPREEKQNASKKPRKKQWSRM